MRVIGLFVLVLWSVSCTEERVPLTEGQVLSIAENLVGYRELDWGSAMAALPPDDGDWWQVRFPPAADGDERIVLVHDESEWARFPDPDDVIRSPLTGSPVLPPEGDAVAPLPGPWILVVHRVQDPGRSTRGELSDEVERLDRLAAETGLFPAFGLRQLPDGSIQITYGWRGDGGIAHDPQVEQWLRVRTDYRRIVWQRLLAVD